MERGAGGGAGERALEQVFKQRVIGDARLNRSSGGANPGDARSSRCSGWGVIRGQRGATCTHERGLAGVRAAGGGCPLWVPPAGSPVRFIYLAPVLLHPQLIEARRSGAERISGGLERVHTSEAL